jgi:hypothetical protein
MAHRGDSIEKWLLWPTAIGLGVLHTWHGRYVMNPDGLAYLDIGEAYLQGDWQRAINAYWSPLYAWLLGLVMLIVKPQPYWESSVVHLVNLAIYVCALGCFRYFWLALSHSNDSPAAAASGNSDIPLPTWLWLVMGYSLFIWSSLNLIGVGIVTPDLIVAAFVYLTSGILLRIAMGPPRWRLFLLLGAILGLSYLTKAAMFPLALVWLTVGMFSGDALRKTAPRVLLALVVFMMVGGPFILALSQMKGRLTFGDSAKLNYAWFVNGIPHYVHWQGEPPGSGTPVHPTRKIAERPTIYEFRTPIGGTYPPWYDPSYWHEGLVWNFDLERQARAFAANIRIFFLTFLFEYQGILIILNLIALAPMCKFYLDLKIILGNMKLLIPCMVTLTMYSIVHIEQRFIGAFIVLIYGVVVSGLRLADSEASRRLYSRPSVAMLSIVVLTVNVLLTYPVTFNLRGGGVWTDWQWHLAEGIQQLGMRRGDQVAVIGFFGFNAYWARLAGVRVTAEIPPQDAHDFWAGDHARQSEIIETFRNIGVKAIVSQNVPPLAAASDWPEIGPTNYHVYLLWKPVREPCQAHSNTYLGVGHAHHEGSSVCSRR